MTEGWVPLRLQKFLARAGVASRRGSERLMSAGRVTVNGEMVTELGSKVDPNVDEVRVDGVLVTPTRESVTLILNKPAGVLTTMKDPQGRACVAELVPTDDYPGLFPVGRLDKDTTGLLVFTTDGDLGQELLHPKNEKTKHYVATVKGHVGERDLQPLRRGITLPDGFVCSPAKAQVLKAGATESVVGVEIHEGHTHQVRDMLAVIGHPVVTLHRDRIGSLKLGNLAEGSWRPLTPQEVEYLKD